MIESDRLLSLRNSPEGHRFLRNFVGGRQALLAS